MKLNRLASSLLVTGISCGATLCFAEATKGEAELGFVNTSGNSETQTINAKLKLMKDTEEWAHQATAAVLSNSSEDSATGEDSTTAERYNLGLQSDKKLDERSSLYALATYEDDRFSGFEFQATLGLGYGYKVVNNDIRTLTLEIGPGYRVNSIKGEDDEKEVTLRLGEVYAWKFSENSEFNQYLTVEGGSDNTISNLGFSVKANMTNTLALKVGVELKHTDEVPAGREDTDTETYANISYSF